LVSSQVQAFDDQGRAAVTTSIDNGQIATETNTYTDLGQPQTESFGSAGNVTVAHGYYPVLGYGQSGSPDALASMTIQNLPSGQANAQTAYGYDSISGRLQTITVNGIVFTIGYVSGSTSQVGSIGAAPAGLNPLNLGVGITLTPDGANASRLGGITVEATSSTGNGNTTDQIVYAAGGIGYNPNNQITGQTVTRTNAGGTQSTDNYGYSYGTGANDNTSDANSLTQVKDNGTVAETYNYDGVGNFTGTSLGDANALNQYSNLTYNARGDVTGDGTYAYTYDANDRMISVTPDDANGGGQKLTYGYDSQGRRIWKNVYTWNDAGESWELDYSRAYAYDGTQLVGELDGNGALLTGYTWSPSGQLLAVTDYTQGTPKTYVAVIDASGNTAMLVDPTNGTVAASYAYNSYGNLLSATGPAQAICSILGKGLYYDVEARSIGHALNRDVRNNIWYERDPAGEIAGGANLYQYLGGDPIDLSDTSGLIPAADTLDPGAKAQLKRMILQELGPGQFRVVYSDRLREVANLARSKIGGNASLAGLTAAQVMGYAEQGQAAADNANAARTYILSSGYDPGMGFYHATSAENHIVGGANAVGAASAAILAIPSLVTPWGWGAEGFLVDQIQTGARQMVSGAPKQTLGSYTIQTAVQKTGVVTDPDTSRKVAEVTYGAVGFAVNLKAALATAGALRAGSTVLPAVVRAESEGTGVAVNNAGFPNPMVEVTRTTPSSLVADARAQFNSLRIDATSRANFLRQFSATQGAQAYFTDAELADMQSGLVPQDWQVHHMQPLFRGGDNPYDNLILVPAQWHIDNSFDLHFYPEGKNPFGRN
jgi:YD repeat-containing protein